MSAVTAAAISRRRITVALAAAPAITPGLGPGDEDGGGGGGTGGGGGGAGGSSSEELKDQECS